MVGISEPLRQAKPVPRRTSRKWNEKLRKRVAAYAVCIVFGSIIATARKNIRRPRLRKLLHYRYFLDRFFCFHQSAARKLQLLFGFAGLSVNCREIVRGQFCAV